MNNDNALYWIWFTTALGIGHRKAKQVYEEYEDIADLYHGKEPEWRSSGIFNETEIKKLMRANINDAKLILRTCEKMGIHLITMESENYPEAFRELHDPPAVLYVKGKLPDLDNILSITVVGSRKATAYGVKNSYHISYNLAKYGVTIISGCAVGIDAAAHNAALKVGGLTVGFVGCGLDVDYPKGTMAMREEIAQKGALISEYPPGTPALGRNYPQRNRMLSIISKGVLVVEAGYPSGALITAKFASEQGLPVFAVMGNIDSPMSKGTNDLIKDGAVPVSDFRDILNYYPNLYSVSAEDPEFSEEEEEIFAVPVKGDLPDNIGEKKVKKAEERGKAAPAEAFHRDVELDEFAAKVYEAIDAKPIHIDELAAKISAPLFKLLPVITELEIQGLIQNVGGRFYQLK